MYDHPTNLFPLGNILYYGKIDLVLLFAIRITYTYYKIHFQLTLTLSQTLSTKVGGASHAVRSFFKANDKRYTFFFVSLAVYPTISQFFFRLSFLDTTIRLCWIYLWFGFLIVERLEMSLKCVETKNKVVGTNSYSSSKFI